MAESIKSLPGEIWKPIPGWEGLYEVSDLGRVWSVERAVKSGIRHSTTQVVWGRVLKAVPFDKYGHLGLALWRNNRQRMCRVHRLVLEAFVGPCPPGMECRHDDGDPGNNRLDNLSWGTPKENQADRKRHGTRMDCEKHPMAKLTRDDVAFIRTHYRGWSRQWGGHVLAKKFGVTPKTIRAIVKRERWATFA